jgi:hypothetical protein
VSRRSAWTKADPCDGFCFAPSRVLLPRWPDGSVRRALFHCSLRRPWSEPPAHPRNCIHHSVTDFNRIADGFDLHNQLPVRMFVVNVVHSFISATESFRLRQSRRSVTLRETGKICEAIAGHDPSTSLRGAGACPSCCDVGLSSRAQSRDLIRSGVRRRDFSTLPALTCGERSRTSLPKGSK